MFFDTHAHYDDEKFNEDRYDILDHITSKKISLILNAACDVESARTSILLAEKYDFIYASVGIHPHQSEAAKDDDFNIIRALTKHKKVKAIGEIGLDYHYDFSPREIQKQWLEKQLQLACELDLPVIIHEREAAFDCFEKIKRFPLRGVYHCYSGSAEMANEILKRGFYISFTGSITFANANRLREVVKRIPLDRMLIETDSPYLAPVPMRGKKNNSEFVSYVAQTIADLKGESLERVAQITMENGKTLFRI